MFPSVGARCTGNTVTLPRLGVLKTFEDTGRLAEKVAGGSARVLSATVSRTAQRWYVSFTVEEERDIPERHARPGSAVGVDLGVKTLLACYDDQGRVFKVPGPKPLRTHLRKLRRASRAHSRKVKGSANGRREARPDPRQGRQRPRRRAAQGHHRPRAPA
jgi:putative transposase